MTPLIVETTSSELFGASIDGCFSMTAMVAVLMPIPGNALKSSHDSTLSLPDLLRFIITVVNWSCLEPSSDSDLICNYLFTEGTVDLVRFGDGQVRGQDHTELSYNGDDGGGSLDNFIQITKDDHKFVCQSHSHNGRVDVCDVQCEVAVLMVFLDCL